MKEIIYCTILSIVLMFVYPFKSDLIWKPAIDFELSYESFMTKDSSPYQLNIILPRSFSGHLNAQKMKNPNRVLELLRESRVFSQRPTSDDLYFKISLILNQQEFNAGLSYAEFKLNMPLQLAINILITEGLIEYHT